MLKSADSFISSFIGRTLVTQPRPAFAKSMAEGAHGRCVVLPASRYDIEEGVHLELARAVCIER